VQFALRVEAATRHPGSIRTVTDCSLFACYSAVFFCPLFYLYSTRSYRLIYR
jgi:hypothetical protein